MKYFVDIVVTSHMKLEIEADNGLEAYRLAKQGRRSDAINTVGIEIKDTKVVKMHSAKNLRKKAGAKQ